jgi:hypothetical protein
MDERGVREETWAREGVEMGQLSVSGAFTITIGHGDGPEVKAFVSATRDDGSPAPFDPRSDELEVFTGLTAMFGTASFPCEVTAVESIYPPPAGFTGVTLELAWVEELGRLNTLGLAALGVIVASGGDRGQGVLTFAGAGTPQVWWSEQERVAPRSLSRRSADYSGDPSGASGASGASDQGPAGG